MPDENTSDPIGTPQPIEPRKGRAILKRFVAVVGISIGGILTLATFVTPTTVRGATRSARLRWQEREKEIQQAVAPAPPTNTDPAATNLQSQLSRTSRE